MNKKVEDIIEISTDIVDELGPIKAIMKVWDKLTEHRINSVFRNCANQLSGNGKIEDKFKKKLNDYLKTEFGQETTFSLINKAIQADNVLTCKMLGVLLGTTMNENRGLTLEEKIIAEALKQMQDSEVQLLKKIQNNINRIPTPPKLIEDSKGDQEKLRTSIQQNSLSIRDFYENKLLQGDLNSDYYSIERLKTMNILTVTAKHEGMLKATTFGLFKFTNITYRVVDLANKIE